jgi:hypothetical protein
MAVNQQKLLGKTTTVQSAKVAPQQQLIAAPADTAALQDISKSLTRILQLLTQQNTQVTNEANQERKNQEAARRKKIELGLEGSFAAVKNVAQAIVAPVKNILDQIIQFFVTLFLGKALLNLIDWFANPENQSKVRSIARFLRDWWPSLIAGYILFGTGFGRAVRSLVGIAARSVILLGGVALKLTGAIARAIGLKKAGTALSALGGSGGGLKGILAKLVVGGATAAGGAVIAKNMMGGGGEEAPQLDVPAAPPLPMAEAFGGGLIDFKTMLAASGGQVDSKLGILTQLFGSGGFASLLHGVPGVVSGPKGIDKVPAMLTDGEFVMSRGAVQKFGVNTLESMNAAGGGTNRPKIVNRKIYAESGGLISNSPDFWKLSAVSAKEDLQNPQGQADVAQSIYNRSLTGAYPGGKSIGNIIMGKDATGAWQYQPVRDNYGAFAAIKDRKSAASAVGESRLNMAIKSITNPTLQKNAKSFVGGRTDFMGESQKPNMKPKEGDITRGKNYNFHGWFYNAKLDTPAPIPNIVTQVSQSQPPSNKPNDSKSQNKPEFSLSNWASGLLPMKFQRGGKVDPYKSKYEKGGMVGENSGSNFGPDGKKLTGPDRQYFSYFAEPGENRYIFTKEATENGAVKYADGIQSALDPKSKAAENMNRVSNTTPHTFNESTKSVFSAKIAKTSPKQKPITPTPKPAPKVITAPQVAGGGMGGARGSGARPTIPSVPAGKSNSKTAKQLGIK